MNSEPQPASAGICVDELWPDLFADLTSAQVSAIRQAFASAAHEGWQANRADVEMQVRRTRGEISHADFVAYTLGRR